MDISKRESQLFGRRLLSHLIDNRAHHSHERSYASIPVSSNLEDGFRDISYGQFANAINRCAYWLKEAFGETSTGVVLTYIGTPDLRYQILAMAAAKTGHIMFFPSPRNTVDQLASLLEAAACTRLITGGTTSSTVQAVLARRTMFCFQVPELEDLLDKTLVAHLALNATFEELRFRPWLIIHTSGSTGNPKLVPIKHGSSTTIDAFKLLQGNDTARFTNSRMFIPFPPFHIAGLMYTLYITCFYDGTAILPPAGAPLTPALVNSIHQVASVDQSVLVPALVIGLTKNQDYLSSIARLKGLTFAGGALSTEVARLIATHTKLASGYGATEYGALTTLPRDPEDWRYFKFSEEGGGIEFRLSDQAGLFELVIVRSKQIELAQGVFITYPDLHEFRTKDLFSKHPTKAGLWQYESRLDDIMVLSNGENLNPIPMEGTISSCPVVSGCLIVGQQRDQTALIVECLDESISNKELMPMLAPFIEKANQICPTYGKLHMDLIWRTDVRKPLSRAPKGTIQRAANNTLFKDEIESLYGNFNVVDEANVVPQSAKQSNQSIEALIRNFIASELGISNFDHNNDFFNYGMDSLMVVNLARRINQQRSGPAIDAAMIYDFPTIAKLANALDSNTGFKDYSDFDSDDEDDKATWTEMEDLFEQLRGQNPGFIKKPKRLQHLLKSNRPPPLYQPDGGLTAWLQILGCFLINFNNWGLVNSFGVYQEYYASDLLSGHAPSSISWAGTLQGALLLLVGVISGPLFDRGYFRTILVVAGLLLVVSLMLLSVASEYYQVILCQGILMGVCMGLLYIPSVAVIPLYFKKHRGLALGIATGGGSIGGVIYPIMFQRLLEAIGFGWANRVIGLIVLTTLSISVVLTRPIGSRSVRQLVDTSSLREVSFVMFMATAFFIFAGVLVPFFLITSYASNELSLGGDVSFYLLTTLNAAQFFGRVISGALADHVGPETLLLGAQLSAAILGYCWIAVKNEGGLVVWAIIYGFVSGFIVTLPAAVLPFICPSLAVLGTRLGMIYAMAGLGFLLSTPVALATNKDGFLGSAVWTGTCCLVGCLLYIVTCREAWDRRRLYNMRKVRAR